MGLDLLIFDDSIDEELRQAEHSKETGISFSIDEWSAFFLRGMAVPRPPYADGDDIAEHHRIERELFLSALSDFPMLSRMDDYFGDAEYGSHEVHQLLKECHRILPRLTEPLSLAFANGLIAGCRKAIESSYGLILVAD